MKIKFLSILKSMGFRYVVFRAWYELCRKTGLSKKHYPTVCTCSSITIKQFLLQAPRFLPMHNSNVPYSQDERELLYKEYNRIIGGEYPFFSGQFIFTGHDSWLTNPKSGYCYDPKYHWSEIADIDPNAGDIKYVWERARFSWVYVLLRSDQILGTESARFLFDSILSFIKSAPDNCGPHWRCGQEISLRVLNWISIIFFYREQLDVYLNDIEFNCIISSIYSQMKHVYQNRNFARIAVRNNHALTEALGLYITGTVFTLFNESKQWKKNGMNALVKEGLYQIYADGTYIQHSFNYQRVAVQIYTFALAVAQIQGDTFPSRLIERLQKMIAFLLTIQDQECGILPNYGANDGALFFPVGRGSYKDFRPQINALYAIVNKANAYGPGPWYDETSWFCGNIDEKHMPIRKIVGEFPYGGYYSFKNDMSFIMIKCAVYRHRPAQADQLHIDVWDRGKNILRDSGSYTYEMTDNLYAFFSGTTSHNTVQVDHYDQMQRGPRFIWYEWPTKVKCSVVENNQMFVFKGEATLYKHIIARGIRHKREVRFLKNSFLIVIIDQLSDPGYNGFQIWNFDDTFFNCYKITAFDSDGDIINGELCDGYYSETYGIFEHTQQLRIPLESGYIRTEIMRIE